jgi:hypothetical protein
MRYRYKENAFSGAENLDVQRKFRKQGMAQPGGQNAIARAPARGQVTLEILMEHAQSL